jgi:hypothetical protein
MGNGGRGSFSLDKVAAAPLNEKVDAAQPNTTKIMITLAIPLRFMSFSSFLPF